MAPLRAEQRSYRHEALLYRGMQGFLASVVPFVRDGVARGEPVIVAVTRQRSMGLREALGEAADQVSFVDIARLGRNPALIIPAWLDFVASHSADGSTPIRAVGEPVWAGRTETEIVECELHEGLLNLAVAPDTPQWIICPYEASALPASIVRSVHRSHPIVVEADEYRGSTEYGGAFHVQEIFQRRLPEPVGVTHAAAFDSTNLRQVESWVEHAAVDAGMPLRKAAELAKAVQQLALDSVRSGEGRAAVRSWTSGSTLICEVTDIGVVTDPMVGRSPRLTRSTQRPGLWSANRTCDLVQVRSDEAGTQVRIHTAISS